MYKRIIFDLDNTLIIWKKEYIRGLDNTIKYFNLDIDSNIIDKLIDGLEYKYDKLSKEILLNEINETCHLNLDMSFINKLFEEQSKLSEYDEEVVTTLEYLFQKYELVVLTNYFKEVQVNRLENAQIGKYFKEVYGGDEFLLKPRSDGFQLACGSFDKSLCLMVGDNYDMDIVGALNYGMDVVACDYKDKLLDSERYTIIRKFSELKDIL